MTRRGESGVILLNVLAVLAIASSVVVLMATLQGSAIGRSERLSDAIAADAIIRGGEAAAQAALRRDATETPDSVDYAQSWARLNENAAPIFGGSFSMRIVDAQARYNVNNLIRPNLAALDELRRMVQVAGLPPEAADALALRLSQGGEIERFEDLGGTESEKAIVSALGPLLVALPLPTKVNVNTADETLLALLLRNGGAARQLTARRQRNGRLTPQDFSDVKAFLPPDAGFTSDYFEVRLEVTYGDVTEAVTSLLRRRRRGGGVVVEVIDRRREYGRPIEIGAAAG